MNIFIFSSYIRIIPNGRTVLGSSSALIFLAPGPPNKAGLNVRPPVCPYVCPSTKSFFSDLNEFGM